MECPREHLRVAISINTQGIQGSRELESKPECRMSQNRQDVQDMTPEKAQELRTYLQAMAAILYEETLPEELNTLEAIEQTVRQKVLQHVKLVGRKLPPHKLYVSPEIGVFLSKQ